MLSIFKTFYEDIDDFVMTERQGRSELISRLLIVGLASCSVGYILSIWTLVAIYALYAIGLIATHLMALRLDTNRNLQTFLITLVPLLVAAICYRAVSLFFWLEADPLLDIVAVLMIYTSTLFTFSQRTSVPFVSYIETSADTLTLLIFAVSLPMAPDPSPSKTVATITIVGVVLYSWVSLRETIAARKAVKTARARSLQAQKMEAIGRLTGGVAHDFNNILTVVMGNLDLHAEVDDPEERAELIRKAHSAADRASRLTAQLLAFSRKSPLQQEKIDTASFLATLYELTERVIPATITIRSNASDGIAPMLADRTQLEVALLNLIINARDAMPKGGRITLTAVNQRVRSDINGLSAGTYVRIEVLDEGQGIETGALDKVLEPFFTTKPVGKGSGLGLSMVKGFAEQSGGQLAIESTIGKGTRVSVLIPAAGSVPLRRKHPFPPRSTDIRSA